MIFNQKILISFFLIILIINSILTATITKKEKINIRKKRIDFTNNNFGPGSSINNNNVPGDFTITNNNIPSLVNQLPPGTQVIVQNGVSTIILPNSVQNRAIPRKVRSNRKKHD